MSTNETYVCQGTLGSSAFLVQSLVKDRLSLINQAKSLELKAKSCEAERKKATLLNAWLKLP